MNAKKFNISINIIEDGNEILETGGGIKNMINNSNEENFLIFNSDTIWNLNYIQCIRQMNEFFEEKKIKNILLVVNKKMSFDEKLNGDFNLERNLLTKNENNEYIYTGCQILCRDLLDNSKKNPFSITEIWDELIKKNNLFGFESKNQFYHVSDLEIYNKLLKSY